MLKRLLPIAIAFASLVAPTVAKAQRATTPARPSVSDRAKIIYETRVVPTLVDVNLRAGVAVGRGVVPHRALALAVVGHAASDVGQRISASRARSLEVKSGGPRSHNTVATIAVAARMNADLAANTPVKNAGMQPRTSPLGQPNAFRARSRLPR